MTAPLILDSDIGTRPDAAIAVAIATLRCPTLALVVTSDETGGQRARLARHLLDLCYRPDVPVVAGASRAVHRPLLTSGLVPNRVPDQRMDVLDAVTRVIATAGGEPVTWCGTGSLTNLADVLTAYPELARRIRLTQQAGTRFRPRVEHTVGNDITAARTVLSAVSGCRLVTADPTTTPGVHRTHRLLQQLAADDAPAWSRLLARHINTWITAAHQTGLPVHAALALSAALGYQFIRFAPEWISIDRAGRITTTNTRGLEVDITAHIDHRAFTTWLLQQLTSP